MGKSQSSSWRWYAGHNVVVDMVKMKPAARHCALVYCRYLTYLIGHVSSGIRHGKLMREVRMGR
jgi:hypothetical protein